MFSASSQAPVRTIVIVTRSRRSLLLSVWVAGCLVATAGALGAYLVAQQVGRRTADDVPQALVTEQVAALAVRPPATGILDATQPLSSRSTPFVIVYDAAHRVVSSTARLDADTPGVPAGTLDQAARSGRAAVTWQPRAGVREAVVAQPWVGASGSGVVVAGVGLGTTEERARSVLLLVFAGWAAVVLAMTGVLGLTLRREDRGRRGADRRAPG